MNKKLKIGDKITNLSLLKTGMLINFTQLDTAIYDENKGERKVEDACIYCDDKNNIFACFDDGLDGEISPEKFGKKYSWNLNKSSCCDSGNIVFRGWYGKTMPKNKVMKNKPDNKMKMGGPVHLSLVHVNLRRENGKSLVIPLLNVSREYQGKECIFAKIYEHDCGDIIMRTMDKYCVTELTLNTYVISAMRNFWKIVNEMSKVNPAAFKGKKRVCGFVASICSFGKCSKCQSVKEETTHENQNPTYF